MQWSSWSKHVFERDDSHAISCAISRQEKSAAYSSPGRSGTWFPSLPHKECTGVRYVITKFSRMDGLPNFITHGAPLARFERRSFAKNWLHIKDRSLIQLSRSPTFSRTVSLSNAFMYVLVGLPLAALPCVGTHFISWIAPITQNMSR